MSSPTTTTRKRRFGRLTRLVSRRQQQRQDESPRSPNPNNLGLNYGSLRGSPHSEDEEQCHRTPSLPNGSGIMSPRFLASERSASLTHDNSAGSHHANDTNLDVVYTLERFLRQALLILGSYCLGVHRPQWLPLFSRLTEWSGVAWSTCIVLLVMSLVQKYMLGEESLSLLEKQEQERYCRDGHQESQEQMPLLVTNRELNNQTNELDTGAKKILNVINDDLLEIDVETGTIADENAEKVIAPQNHPALDDVYVINVANGKRVYSNSISPVKLENDLFEGEMMVMLRTPDCDDSKAVTGNEENQRVSNYLRSKQRRFEFQYQLKLKKVPEGRVYFGCEVDKMPRLGMMSKAFVSAAMSFMKRMNSGFHFNMTNERSPDGRYEKPHVSFTVEDGFNRLVTTKPGHTPPKLGEEIHENPESIAKRTKHGIKWNTEDTYTFSVWSAYLDFIGWSAVNVPGMIRPVSLVSVFEMQPLNAVLYVVPHLKQDQKGPDKHFQCDKYEVANIEISNAREAGYGQQAKLWVTKNKAKVDDTLHDSTLQNVADDEDERDDDDVPVEDEDDDEATVAELGEGMYLRSGDAVILRESLGEDEAGLEEGNYVTNGDGFAVVQSQSSPTIVMEKARRSRSRSKLIKNGDAVMIKMITKNKSGEIIDIKYLSIHRGWWLKWVSIPPSKNGFFVVHTNDVEFDVKDGKPLRSPEPQNSFLTVGGTFWLRHRRWSKYQIGISVEESPTFGGRMLGLYRPNHASNDDTLNPDDEDDGNKQSDLDDDVGLNGRAAKNKWMKPLRLNAQFPSTQGSNYVFQTPMADANAPSTPRTNGVFNFSPEDQKNRFNQFSELDVPAWIEMMHRTERRPALVYVIRGTQLNSVPTGSDPSGGESEEFLRLRTGRDLREIIRLGLSWSALRDRRRSAGVVQFGETTRTPRTPTRSSSRPILTENESLSPKVALSMPVLEKESPQESGLDPSYSLHDDREAKNIEKESDAADYDDSSSVDSDEGSVTEDFEEVQPYESGPESNDLVSNDLVSNDLVLLAPKRKKGRKIMGQLSQKIKSGTSNTGKRVKKVGKGTVSAGKKVGKGTVTAGKAIIAPISRSGVRPNKPPAREPKSTGKGKRRKKEREHEVVNRAMKSIANRNSLKWLSKPPSVLAGQLSAPEQSRRTVSHVLSETSNLPASSSMSTKFDSMLSAQLASLSELDRWFLQGGSIELGVVPAKREQALIHDCLLARCLWESHWREEWCGIYKDMIVFYAPLAKKPLLEIAFQDVQAVRHLEPGYGSPLPGFSLLAVETAWRCHYVAFRSDEARDAFSQHLNSQIFSCESTGQVTTPARKSAVEKDIWKARFWQGFQSSAESSMSGDHAKWAKITTMNKKKDRIILNSRKMVFDIDPIENEKDTSVCEFVENLLSTSLTFSLDSLQKDPDAFVTFIDSTSRLRSLNLSNVDFGSEEGFCLFANLYHCLLQHAMLLSLDGPLRKRSIFSFMHCTCYEIGGDVFSLAELRCSVLRGKMSRPMSQKPPYIEPAKKSNAYCFYALDYLDPRTNFLLNTGDLSCPPEVPVLSPLQLEQQLQSSTEAFIRKELVIDVAKKVIFLPKVCDVYRNDYGNGDPTSILMYCLKYLEESEQKRIMRHVKSSDAVIKFQSTSEQYYDFLKMREDASNNEGISDTTKDETLVHI